MIIISEQDFEEIIHHMQERKGNLIHSHEVMVLQFMIDDLLLSKELILYLIDYCASIGKMSINYIKAVAINWHHQGLVTVKKVQQYNLLKSSFKEVLMAFGITNRQAGTVEIRFMKKWFDDLQMSLEIIMEACNRTLLRTSQANFEYCNKILEYWHQNNVRTLVDIGTLDATFQAKGANHHTNAHTGRNKFHNFEQREQDFDSLEDMLWRQQKERN